MIAGCFVVGSAGNFVAVSVAGAGAVGTEGPVAQGVGFLVV